MLIINMEKNNMTNAIFFTLGFISFKVINFIIIKIKYHLEYRKRLKKWCCKGNYRNSLHYDRRIVR